jgi:hypothetical protein
MSGVFVRSGTRALTFAAALAVGLAALMMPATPAEAGGLPDLEMHGTGEATLNLRTSQLVHRFVVNANGPTPVAPGKAAVVVAFPNGVQPKPNGFQAVGQARWDCTVNPSVLICKNLTELRSSQGATYFLVDLAVSGPMTAKVTSSVDPFDIFPESNEGNNVGTFTYRFVQ